MIFPQDFFDLQENEYEDLFQRDVEVWTVLKRLETFVSSFFKEIFDSILNCTYRYTRIVHNGTMYSFALHSSNCKLLIFIELAFGIATALICVD